DLHERVRDEAVLTTLVWTAEAIDRIVRESGALGKALVDRIAPFVNALVHVSISDLADVVAIRPDRLDLSSLRASGRPWSALGEVAEELIRAETDLEFLAYEIIEPIPELAWRLFHLSVLGAVLQALRASRGKIRWLNPLAASRVPGPKFEVVMPDGLKWDVWFEASGADSHYGVPSLYRDATEKV